MPDACPICDGLDIHISGPYRANHVCFTGLKRAHCNSCGMDFASPMPNESELVKFNSNYFHTAHGGKAVDPASKAFFSGIARLRMAHIEEYLNKHSITVEKLLELGPGEGFFARNWLEKYPETIYEAVETDTSCHDTLNKAGVTILENIKVEGDARKYDLIVMSHIMEHVTEPVNFLKNAVQNLRKGGVVFIEVPCMDWQHKNIDEPHLLFFDKGPMQQLLALSGFEEIELSYHGQTIQELRSASAFHQRWLAIRSKLIALAVLKPFSKMEHGMETLKRPIERAAVAPFKAHHESSEPAWWLRALARKR